MVEHQIAAVAEHERGHEPADELHGRPVHRAELLRPEVRGPVAVVEVFEDLLVARLTPERVHRLDAAEAFDEVHDHQRDGLACGPVRALGPAAEPTGDHEQHRERAEGQQREAEIEEQERDADSDHQQQRGDEVDDAVTEQIGDRFDVGGLPRDHAARGVALVERHAEPLEVLEQPAADVEDDVLAHPPEQNQERVERDRRDHGRDQHAAHNTEERADGAAPSLEQRGDAVIDADLDQPRNRELRRGADRDEQRRDDDRTPVRANEIAEQRAAPGAQQAGEPAGDLLLLFGLDPAPRVDQFVAGHVEHRVGVDLVHLVRLYGAHAAPTSGMPPPPVCAWLLTR